MQYNHLQSRYSIISYHVKHIQANSINDYVVKTKSINTSTVLWIGDPSMPSNIQRFGCDACKVWVHYKLIKMQKKGMIYVCEWVHKISRPALESRRQLRTSSRKEARAKPFRGRKGESSFRSDPTSDVRGNCPDCARAHTNAHVHANSILTQMTTQKQLANATQPVSAALDTRRL